MAKTRLEAVIDGFLIEGKKDEEFVAQLLESTCGGRTSPSSADEDKYQHVDLWWDSPKAGRLGIDVKGVKRNTRHDSGKDDSIHWLEIQGVTGMPGWIYGDSVYIAFRTLTDVIFVRTDRLREWCEKVVANKDIVDKCPQECYVPYRRLGRKDLIFKCPTEALRDLSQYGGFIIDLRIGKNENN
ncbi:MAG: hypothetical protein LUD72_01620 [Bacteroidales bacterium]|nr:hypothetical protein [Bacteroidales bacterium]